MVIWKPIEGYRVPYRINRKGAVERQRKDGSWVRVAQCPDSKGYPRVFFRKVDGTQHRRMLSTLLYEHFGPDVDGANRPRNVPVEMIDIRGRVIKEYPSLADAARDANLTVGSIEYRCKGRMKHPFKHYDFTFRYKEIDTYESL